METGGVVSRIRPIKVPLTVLTANLVRYEPGLRFGRSEPASPRSRNDRRRTLQSSHASQRARAPVRSGRPPPKVPQSSPRGAHRRPHRSPDADRRWDAGGGRARPSSPPPPPQRAHTPAAGAGGQKDLLTPPTPPPQQ